ncbi:hypothetical protein FQN53_008428 [Emmonsiellopsis sp. PD_33]|nr:hypothetical protein FQN53_008428 [Emmonsiellopsis sp. PD_33]
MADNVDVVEELKVEADELSGAEQEAALEAVVLEEVLEGMVKINHGYQSPKQRHRSCNFKSPLNRRRDAKMTLTLVDSTLPAIKIDANFHWAPPALNKATRVKRCLNY